MISLIKKMFGGEGKSSAAETEQTEVDAAPVLAEAKEVVEVDADLAGFVEYVVKALVDQPDEITVSAEDEGRAITINITCANGDAGKIIGRQGKTISAIRSLASGAAGKAGKKVNVEVLD